MSGNDEFSMLASHYIDLAKTPISSRDFCGQDVRYTAEFEALESELAKADSLYAMTGPDWNAVREGSTNLLHHQSKDLRAAVWLAWSLYQSDSFNGLQAGMAALLYLCSHHWDDLYPRKLRTRQASFNLIRLSDCRRPVILLRAQGKAGLMSFNHYYQSELTALRQLGKRFAERSPALAPFLGQSGRDPDVERLLEGFAFLTGRLRQKLDDELPELTHSLMYLLWPNYMRPLPAFSVLQFESLDSPGAGIVVPRGTPVESTPVKGVACRFRTTSNIELTALTIRQVDYSAKGQGALLSLQLAINGGASLADLTLEKLRLHLAGERYISQTLYLGLMRHLDDIQVVLLDADGKPLKDSFGKTVTPLKIAPDQLQPAGFAEDEALVPYPVNTFRGYRYLQEYFAFQEKFLFVDLAGLGALHSVSDDLLKRARGIELRFDLSQTSAQRIRPGIDNIRLHCRPIVNLFAHDATPIRLDGRQDKYMLRTAEFDASQCGVFSVDRVTGWKPGGMGYEEYVPFESFEHDASFDFPETRPYYSLRQNPSLMNDGMDTYLSFGQRSLEQHETLSVELTCTNQNLPLQLALGDICRASEGTPEFLRFRNISAITPHYAPPLHQDFLWKLISNMSLNYLSLANVEALKVILETYDLPRHYDQHAAKVSQRLLNGLKAIKHGPIDRLYRGLPIRSVRTELQMDSDGYLGEGDLFMFASVLNEFFALYASLNSYHELVVKST